MVIGPSFFLNGFEPPAVRTAILADRLAFWTAVSGFVAEAKMTDLRAGLDKDGVPMVAITDRTKRYRRSAMWWVADPDAPPLQPAYDMSRTRSLFRAEATSIADGVVCYWAFDSHTGDSWGEILDYHRQGAGALPVRDVFGLSPASIATVKRRASAWWRGYVAGNAVNPGSPGPTGGPPPVAGRLKQGHQVIDFQGGFRVGAPPRAKPGHKLAPIAPKLPSAGDLRRRLVTPNP